MKLKLDENFDARPMPELLQVGFDADTVKVVPSGKREPISSIW
jgi:hypothetical protein